MGAEKQPERGAHKPKEGASLEAKMQSLKGITPEDIAIFGLELHRSGILSRLEEMEVIPTAQDPNPHDFEIERSAHEKWWDDHPAEGARFERVWEARSSALKYLYIGALFGNLFPEKLLPNQPKNKR